ncbi:hypothetical protein [uncultured Thiodictyon sp.]|uniref:hypothetical protein n=1 Tax=uncultured Thiodictyon sp. TaxID=1846217 RepID=UPI0025CCAD6D|nr:hypothetical protein [uncultured Thiodictyon sp.]
MSIPDQRNERETIERVFGAENRARLLKRYFDANDAITPQDAWRHVYRLLLWIDRTTALAHCYESDKAQPGRAWYERSLAFHDWLATALGLAPAELGDTIDWLFREAIGDLASQALASRSEAYEKQRAPYAGRGFPEPGEDPDLVGIIRDMLAPWMDRRPPDDELRKLTRRIHAHLSQENKRRNLVGEGFEDVIAAVVSRLTDTTRHEIRNRAVLHELPGFHAPAPNEKIKKVDLAIIGPRQRNLISAKWSIRADREEQFLSDFEAYARLESAGQNFSYTLITNEFDAARLKAACERRRQNALLFTHVVHINPKGMLAAYGESGRGAAKQIRTHVETGRLMDLATWLEAVVFLDLGDFHIIVSLLE